METRPAKHPTAEVLKAFGLGKLDDSSSGALMAHLDLCADCRKIVASQSGDDFLDRLRQAHSRSATPAPPKSLGGMEGKPKPPPGPTTLFNLPPELADNPQYEILKELGRGGMGVVYLAKNKLMDRLEVLKVINKALLDRPGAVERFLREIRSAAMLHHVNVVAAYSALQLGGLLVFAMEYVEGQDLAAVVKANGPLPVPHACFYVQQAAQGLQHAFEKKMVHRDIKPQNLILAREGRKHLVKVLDFGLAKVMREKTEETGLTGEGNMLGTPDYMAPEQALDAATADIRADIYSLGCTLYFLLSGNRPFPGKNVCEVVLAHQSLEAPALKAFRPQVPAELAAVVRKMMAKDRAQRYQTPLEVVQALRPFLKQAAKPKSPSVPVVKTEEAPLPTTQVKPPPLPASPPSVAWDSLTESVLAAARPPNTGSERGARKRWLMGGAGVAGLLVLGLLSYWLMGVLFRVETPTGTLVVEINDNEVEARIKNGKLILSGPDGKDLYILSPHDRRKQLEAGPYQIRVEGVDGLVLDTPKFTLKKGDLVKVQVTLEPKAIAPAAAAVPADALRRTDIPKAVLASLGGGDPKRAPPELVAVLGEGQAHGGAVRDLKFSADGRWFATSSLDRTVLLWETATGRVRRILRGFTGLPGHALAFSRDGRTLVFPGQGGTLKLWPTETDAQPVTLQTGLGEIWALDASPDGRFLAAGSKDGAIVLWKWGQWDKPTSLASIPGPVWTLAFSPDGELLASGCIEKTQPDGCYTRVYKTESGELKYTFPGHSETRGDGTKAGHVRHVSISRDGRLLASVGVDNKLKVWDLTSGKPVADFNHHCYHADTVTFSADGRRLAVGTIGGVGIYDLASRSREGGTDAIRSSGDIDGLAFSPDGKLLAVGDHVGNVLLYETAGWKPQKGSADLGHTRDVYSVAFSPDGLWLASGSVDNTVRVWDLATGKQRHKLEQHTAPVWSVAFSPDSKLLASGSHDGTIALWDPITGARVRLLRGHFGESSVRFSPDGKFVGAGRGDGGAQIWFVRNGEEARTLRGLHGGRVRCLAFSADGQRIATGGDDGKLAITDLASGNILRSFKRNTGVFTVDFGADGETVAAGYAQPEPVVRLWNLKDKDFVVLQGHTDRVDTVSLRSDGRLAVTTSLDGSVRLWEVGANLLRKMVLGIGSVGERLWMGALSPDGRYVATGNSNGTIYLFRLPGKAENIGEWLAARGTPPRGLSEEAWTERVNGLYVGNVPDAIAERLRELNPGFDRPLSPVIEGGVVTELRCSGNVKDISPLKGLKLKIFHCDGSQVSDLSPLKDMKLTYLNCGFTPVSDLSPLKGMPLTSFGCYHTQVSDLSPLKDMKLTHLNCSNGTPVSDLSPLKGMPLTTLHCDRTPVSDLTPLKGMPLTTLLCDHTRVSDLTPLKGTKLTVLSCFSTPVSDLSPLKDMKLTELNLAGTRVSDLTPLRDMKLRTLWCGETQVTDAGVMPLQDMSGLRTLSIGSPKMTDAGVEYLKNLTDLEVLHLYNRKLTDEGLVHLKGVFGLRELGLQHTRVTDAGLEHLAGLKNLADLNLKGTAVTDKGVAKLKAALPRCNIIR